jgi:ribosomal protein S18 acetylase RimI-like enzyme
MTIAFRTAGHHDIPLIQAMSRAIWPDTYLGIISEAQIAYMLDLMYATSVIGDEMQRGVAWELTLLDEVPVGYLSWQRLDGGRLKINKLYLLPAGRGMGIAAAAVDRVRRSARDRGCSHVTLVVNKRNARAIAAYRRIGFAIEADIVTDIGQGFVMDDHRMVIPA